MGGRERERDICLADYAVNASDTLPGCLLFQKHATQGTGWVHHQHCLSESKKGEWMWGVA